MRALLGLIEDGFVAVRALDGLVVVLGVGDPFLIVVGCPTPRRRPRPNRPRWPRDAASWPHFFGFFDADFFFGADFFTTASGLS